ncbi:hypothetical protein TorRG33x02_133980 [Trema orientale]|uniref:Uncharacterized protein n=1 Tax=Trema orientale TaxID=63057 RepID=A0A2P5EZ07_TREOI|nr:hypothetical protein TorRG33x02_133980 [Trema orientale]
MIIKCLSNGHGIRYNAVIKVPTVGLSGKPRTSTTHSFAATINSKSPILYGNLYPVQFRINRLKSLSLLCSKKKGSKTPLFGTKEEDRKKF